MLCEPLKTKDLLLRPLVDSDANGPYSQWFQNREVTRYLEVRFSPPDQDGLRDFIARNNASSDNLLLGMFLKDEPDRHVGNIKLGPINRHHRRAVMGLMVGDKAQWGKGFASQAIAAVTDFAFQSLGVERMVAGIYSTNIGSQKAFLKAGWHEEARLPRYWLLDDKWVDDVLFAKFKVFS